MSKRLAVLFALLTVSVASAATLKMKWFDMYSGEMDGVATLHYVPGQGVTKVHVTITGFQPNTAYVIKVAGGAFEQPVVTNNGGNAEASGSVISDITGEAQPVVVEEAGIPVAEGTAQ
ncbi:MAG: hypothetical protein AMXMBFR47_14780 [Planctomycetota bacterium]